MLHVPSPRVKVPNLTVKTIHKFEAKVRAELKVDGKKTVAWRTAASDVNMYLNVVSSC